MLSCEYARIVSGASASHCCRVKMPRVRFCTWPLESDGEWSFGAYLRGPGPPDGFPGLIHGDLHDRFLIGYFVCEADLFRLPGINRFSREYHVEAVRKADKPRQPLRAAESGDDAEPDLGLCQR